MRAATQNLTRCMRLTDWRIAGSGGWRVARAGAGAASVLFTLAIVYLALRGQGALTAGILGRSAVVIGWIAGLGVAWWSATDRAAADRDDGWSALARSHGLAEESLALARAATSLLRLSLLVSACMLPVVVASVAASPSWQVAGWRLAALLPVLLFALCVGVVGGAFASVCGVLSPRHGRALLAAVVLLPWALDGVFIAGRARVGSLPGLLGFLADLASQIGAVP
jgi:hypothetical protein